MRVGWGGIRARALCARFRPEQQPHLAAPARAAAASPAPLLPATHLALPGWPAWVCRINRPTLPPRRLSGSLMCYSRRGPRG